MSWRAGAALMLQLTALGCAENASRLEVRPLADGEWTVIGHTVEGAVLRKSRDMQPARNRRRTAPHPDTFAVLGDTLTPVRPDTFTLAAAGSQLQFVRFTDNRFFASAHGSPQLLPSPSDPNLYAFEFQDAIWVLKAPGKLHKLTLDYDRDALITRQREGVVILYWSANPMWSADGKFLSFLSNREAVRNGTSGQSLWVIDAYTGIQGPLYDAAEESVHSEGALGDEFAFISNAKSGVFAVHMRTSAVRKLGDGYVLAAHPRGRALVSNNEGRLTLVRQDGNVVLSDAPSGHVWSTHAGIAPAGDRVALYSTNQSGGYALHVLGPSVSIPAVELSAPPSTPPAWTDDGSIIFTVQESRGLRTYRAVIR